MASRIPAAVLIAAILVPASGCGSADEETPAACLSGPAAYSRALHDAPEAVSLGGGTKLSDCLTENQSAGELTQVGGAMVAVATSLNAQARAPGGEAAARRLGYLIGAARHGAEGTDGIHASLVQRLASAAEFSPGGSPLAPGIEAAYQAGVAAGAARG
jgi:hypothetical protein